jgi:succinate dehydrogenase/fumarate reductase iron-sulfur protein
MTDQTTTSREITFRVHRFDPDTDSAPSWEEYRLPVTEGMTVLEALHELKARQAPTLAWRSSCRMGVCGSCGMFINDFPRLACQTQVLHLGTDVVSVAPLPNYPNVKDLVPDLEPLIQKHAAIKPFIIHPSRKEMETPTGEFLQTAEEREAFSQFTYCIKCGLCLAACPTVATDPPWTASVSPSIPLHRGQSRLRLAGAARSDRCLPWAVPMSPGGSMLASVPERCGSSLWDPVAQAHPGDG